MRYIRQGAAVLLCTAYLLVGTPAAELLKIPVLIEHYREHQAELPHISFWEYLSLHYFKGTVYDADYQRDMQLPFKSISLVSVLLLALQPPSDTWRALNHPGEDIEDKHPASPQNEPISPYLSRLYPPPEA